MVVLSQFEFESVPTFKVAGIGRLDAKERIEQSVTPLIPLSEKDVSHCPPNLD
jgi:hypothetical protein